jgi:hypothetical protein
MSFTLNLGFGGLCLFVPEHDNQGELVRMHVVLPPFTYCEPHFQELVHDEMAPHQGQPHNGVAIPVNIFNSEFDLSGASQAPVLQLPPPQVPSLTTLFGARVPRSHLVNNNTGGVVASRARFDAGNSAIACGGVGDFWFFPDFAQSVRLPIRVIWSLEVDAASLVVQITGINGSTNSRQLTLFPDPQNGKLDLWVFNSPGNQIPTQLPPRTTKKMPKPKDPACHFAGFYHPTAATFPIPTYDRAAPRLPEECFEPEGDPGLDVTCIGAQALPMP